MTLAIALALALLPLCGIALLLQQQAFIRNRQFNYYIDLLSQMDKCHQEMMAELDRLESIMNMPIDSFTYTLD